MPDEPAVVVVHERFSEMGGSEKVVEQMKLLWPAAKVFAPISDPQVVAAAGLPPDVAVSPLQRLYRGGSTYAHLLPLLPLAMKRADLRTTAGTPPDLIVTSHHAFANRVRPPAGVPTVSYTHTPARWLWDQSKSNLEAGRIGSAGLAAFARTQRPADKAAAARMTRIIANSRAVQQRVRDWWDVDCVVIPPPVSVAHFTFDPTVDREDFFLVAGRLVPYKRPDLAIEAAVKAGVRLVVAGEGRFEDECRHLAGPNVDFKGRVSDDELRDLYRRCAALIMPGEEDFGIIPVEAQACGAPVIALGAGGALDSVVPGVTGVHVPVTETAGQAAAFAETMTAFRSADYDAVAIRAHAETFAPESFRDRLNTVAEQALAVA